MPQTFNRTDATVAVAVATPSPAGHVGILTFQDAVHHLLDFVGADLSSQAIRHARTAVKDALRELHIASNWTYLYTFDRITTSAPYSTGTVTYDHTGGTYERQITLTGGTWPTWAKQGTLILNGVPYEIEDRKSSTIITLTLTNNPGADVTTASTFVIYRDSYQLPFDYKSGFEFLENTQWHGMKYVHPKDWAYHRVRTDSQSSGAPLVFTVIGDPDNKSRLIIRVYPYPDQAYNYDYVYMRKPGDLITLEYKTGTVSVTNGSATLAGSGTSWNSTYNGLSIRIKATDSTVADGITETGPYGFERNAYYVHESIVDNVASATSLTLKDVVPETLSGVKYVISSIVDIEGESMTNAFNRLCEKHMAVKMNMESKGEYVRLAQQALVQAKEADSRYNDRKRIGGGHYGNQREYDIHRPLGPDVL